MRKRYFAAVAQNAAEDKIATSLAWHALASVAQSNALLSDPIENLALVDAEGVVLSLHTSYPEGYPVITGISGSSEPGRMIIEAQPAMEVLQNISRSGLIGLERISELVVDGKLVQVSLMGSGTVLVFGHGNTDAQVKKLARLMEAGAFDARSAGYDLRYEGRVIGMPEINHDASGEKGLSPVGG